MARTLSEIYQQLVDEKQAMTNLSALQPNTDSLQTLLTDLTTSSKVAIWRLFFYVVAFGIWVAENLIEIKITQHVPATTYWWYQLCLKFQYGDALVLVDGDYVYATIIEANKIIKYAAADEQSDGKVVLKVAADSSGSPIPLTSGQMTSFKTYIKFKRPAGTKIVYRSDVADILKTAYTIHYDPLVLNPDGSLISDSGVFPVEDTINSYIKNLIFNGVFAEQTLTDNIQKTAGVVIAVPTMIQAKYGLTNYVNVLTLPARQYKAFSGYMKISIASGETLADTLTYTAYV